MGKFESFESAGNVRALPGADNVHDYLSTLRHSSGRLKLVRAIQRVRARRPKHFTATLFSDPAWDLLLQLFAVHLEQRRTTIGGLCRSTRVSGTTALRWLAAFEKEGLVERRCDPFDARRVFVALSAAGASAATAFIDSASAELGWAETAAR